LQVSHVTQRQNVDFPEPGAPETISD